MIHFVIIVFFLALIVGTAAIAWIFLVRKQYRLPFLAHLFYGMLFLNLGALTAVISYYLKANIVGGTPGVSSLTRLYFRWNGVLGTGLLGGMSIFFLLMIAALLEKKPTFLFKGTLLAGWAAILGAQAAAIVLGLSHTEITLNWSANHIITNAVFLGSGLYFLLRAKGVKPRYRRRSLFGFARMQLGWILTWVGLRIIYYAGLIDPWVFTLSEAVLFLITNVLVLLFLKGFAAGIEAMSGAKPASGESREKAFSRFGITQREQEIILLICEGRSNREIKDLLFLSLQSVKDHIYRIYRKTGVKNRVQLANLFAE